MSALEQGRVIEVIDGQTIVVNAAPGPSMPSPVRIGEELVNLERYDWSRLKIRLGRGGGTAPQDSKQSLENILLAREAMLEILGQNKDDPEYLVARVGLMTDRRCPAEKGPVLNQRWPFCCLCSLVRCHSPRDSSDCCPVLVTLDVQVSSGGHDSGMSQQLVDHYQIPRGIIPSSRCRSSQVGGASSGCLIASQCRGWCRVCGRVPKHIGN